MLALRLARFEHLVDIAPGRRSCRASSARTARVRVGAGTTARRRRDGPTRWPTSVPLLAARDAATSGTSRSATAARSAARSPTPIRPPSTRRWRSPSTRRSRSLSPRGAAHDAGRRVLHRRSGRPRSEPDELLTASRFPVWTGRCGFARRGVRPPPRRLRHRRRRRSAVELDDDERGRPAAASACSASGPRRCGRRAAEAGRRRAARRPTSTPTSSAGWRSADLDDDRRPTCTARPTTGHGSARRWSAGAWQRARSRRPGRWHEIAGRCVTVNGAPAGRPSSRG